MLHGEAASVLSATKPLCDCVSPRKYWNDSRWMHSSISVFEIADGGTSAALEVRRWPIKCALCHGREVNIVNRGLLAQSMPMQFMNHGACANLGYISNKKSFL